MSKPIFWEKEEKKMSSADCFSSMLSVKCFSLLYLYKRAMWATDFVCFDKCLHRDNMKSAIQVSLLAVNLWLLRQNISLDMCLINMRRAGC